MSIKRKIKVHRFLIALGAFLSSGAVVSEAKADNSFENRVEQVQQQSGKRNSPNGLRESWRSGQEFGNTGFQNGFFNGFFNGFANGWCSGPGCQ